MDTRWTEGPPLTGVIVLLAYVRGPFIGKDGISPAACLE
jgi:hypothetical protein